MKHRKIDMRTTRVKVIETTIYFVTTLAIIFSLYCAYQLALYL